MRALISAQLRQTVLDYRPVVRTKRRLLAHLLLAGGTITYLLINALFLWLTATGVIFPPFGVIGFFSVVGPVIVSIFVGSLQMFIRPVPFHWAALVAFYLIIGSTAYVNMGFLAEASASV